MQCKSLPIFITIIAIFAVVVLLVSCSVTLGTANDPPEIPKNPIPAEDAKGAIIATTLSWKCSDNDGDVVTFDVYLGTDSTNLQLVSENQSLQSYTPDALDYSTTYFWKILANDGKDTTAGSVWSFTTGAKYPDGTYFWCAGNDYIYKINPNNGEVVSSLSTPTDCTERGLAWDGSYLWLVDGGDYVYGKSDQYIYKIDPDSGNIVHTITCPDGGDDDSALGLTFDGSYLYLSVYDISGVDDTIYKINPADGSIVDQFDAPSNMPCGLAWDGSHLWNADSYSINTLYKLNADNGDVIDSADVNLPSTIHGIAWDGSYIWVSDGSDAFKKIYKYDVSTEKLVSSFDAPDDWSWGLSSEETTPKKITNIRNVLTAAVALVTV